ncbi:hypothetical protein KC717_03100 [Candidatus Dojkabacteria bacterium]|uniref:Polymer-forming cytoskeletal protein n=1 Tax=Candidatus Dojkabacteria bacterium TaxID=2099670 RepID=A0A955L7U6_9BACT|nr:hypothetical protein [Candidatus Dojkabacteria bacterium]
MYAITVVIALIGVTSVFAQEIPLSAPIPDSVRIQGTDSTIEEQVEGDLFATAGYVEVLEGVKENVFFFGGTFIADGKLDESVFLMGNLAHIQGDIEDNVFAMVQDAQFDGEIGSDLYFMGNRLIIKDDVDGDLFVNAREVYIDKESRVRGDFHVNAQVVKIHPEAEIRGDIIVVNGTEYAEEVDLQEYRREDVPVTLTELPAANSGFSSIRPYLSSTGLLLLFAVLLGSAIAIAAIVKVFPVKSERVVQNMRFNGKNIFANIKIGVIATVLTTILLVVLSVSLVGLPLLFLVITLIFLVSTLAKLYFPYKLGREVVMRIQPKASGPFVNGLVGNLLFVLLVLILLSIPGIGMLLLILLSLLIFIWSVGAVIRVKVDDYKNAQR